jgi:hypothetical protein
LSDKPVKEEAIRFIQAKDVASCPVTVSPGLEKAVSRMFKSLFNIFPKFPGGCIIKQQERQE